MLFCAVPYTEYDLQVAAFTQKGIGEKSDKYPGLTDVRGQRVNMFVLAVVMM